MRRNTAPPFVAPIFQLALCVCVTMLGFVAPVHAQQVVGIAIPVGSMDGSSHPLDQDVWSVSSPSYPLAVGAGIGFLVNPAFLLPEGFTLHDHQYLTPHVPSPERAVVTYEFDREVAVNQLEVIQHTNGITEIEGFFGNSLDALTSVGTALGPAGDVTGESVFSEGESTAFVFNNVRAGRFFRFVIRKTSLLDGWASYRVYPIDGDGRRIRPGVPERQAYRWGLDSGGGIPTAVAEVPDPVALGAGTYHSLAVRADGTVWAWGANGSGQLGPGAVPGAPSATPIQVLGINDAVSVAGGFHSSHAVGRDGTLWSWGSAYTGLGGYSSFAPPTPVPGLSGVVSVAAGEPASYAVLADGTLWSWGFNGTGQLGVGSYESAYSPVRVTSLQDVTAVATHFVHALALTRDGTVWAWGHNSNGQLGDGTQTDRNIPIRVSTLDHVRAIGAGAFESYALREDGTVWTWGRNLGGGPDRTAPVQVPGLVNIVSIAAGGFHLLALQDDGSLWGWGDNTWGQLGMGAPSQFQPLPVHVSGLDRTGLLVAGRAHSLAALAADTTPPVLSLPETITADGTSPDGTVISYVATAIDDLDSAPAVTCSPASDSMFPLLLTVVRCAATDAAGNTALGTFEVMVKDASWQLADVESIVQSWNLRGLGSSLISKLDSAARLIVAGQASQACNILASLLHEVRAQSSKGLTFDQATELEFRVSRIRAACGC